MTPRRKVKPVRLWLLVYPNGRIHDRGYRTKAAAEFQCRVQHIRGVTPPPTIVLGHWTPDKPRTRR